MLDWYWSVFIMYGILFLVNFIVWIELVLCRIVLLDWFVWNIDGRDKNIRFVKKFNKMLKFLN